jgi:hypothetical protein
MAQTDSLSDEHTPMSFACQEEGTLVAVQAKRLRPHGYDGGVVGVSRVDEQEGDVISAVRLSVSPVRFQPTKFLSLIDCYWDLLP